jgi:alanine racemase
MDCASKDTRVVTIPIGYGDGYMRCLSNRAHVLINGRRYPIVGTICMDQLMVDVGDDEAFNGEEVVLIGTQGSEHISVEELAKSAETIPYEILTNLNLRIQRKFTHVNVCALQSR